MEDNIQEVLADLIGSSLLMVPLGHFWHLTCDTASKHAAFGDFYAKAQDFTDRIAEAALGFESFDLDAHIPDYDFEFTPYQEASDILEDFEEVLHEAYEVLEDQEDYRMFCNIIDEYLEMISQTEFKLSRLE